MKSLKKAFLLLLLFNHFLLLAQPRDFYFDKSKMVGFPSLVKNIKPYQAVNEGFAFFSFDEKQYNGLFYRNYIHESGATKAAWFSKMNLVFTKPFIMKWTQFPGYQVTVNPNIKDNQYSQHGLAITKTDEKTVSNFQTDAVKFSFPKGALIPVNEKDSTALLVKTSIGLEHHNQTGFKIKDITGFEMSPFMISGTPITITGFKNCTFDFAVKEEYDIVFESNDLANFINTYFKLGYGKKPSDYANALQFSGAEATIKLNETVYKGRLAELYFSENLTAGVLDITVKNKENFANDVAFFYKNKPNPHIKANFKEVKGVYGSMYYWIKQDYKSTSLYFFMLR